MECEKCERWIGEDTAKSVSVEWYGEDWLQVTLICECGAVYVHDMQISHFYSL